MGVYSSSRWDATLRGVENKKASAINDRFAGMIILRNRRMIEEHAINYTMVVIAIGTAALCCVIVTKYTPDNKLSA